MGIGINWIDLAEDRDRWRAIINAIMDLRVLPNGGKGGGIS